jgi:hypothetical protein
MHQDNLRTATLVVLVVDGNCSIGRVSYRLLASRTRNAAYPNPPNPLLGSSDVGTREMQVREDAFR